MELFKMVPHMNEEEIIDLTISILGHEVNEIDLAFVYPYISDKCMTAISDILIQNQQQEGLYELLPFLSRSRIDELIEKSIKNNLEIDEAKVLPYLSEKMVKRIVNSVLEQKTQEINENMKISLHTTAKKLEETVESISLSKDNAKSEYHPAKKPKKLVDAVPIIRPKELK